MFAVPFSPFVHTALGRAASSVDVAVVKFALCASLRKKWRLRQLEHRRRHYDEMGERYAELNDALYAAPDSPIRPMRDKRLYDLPHGAVYDMQWASGYEPCLPSARDAFLRWRANGTAHARHFRHDHEAPTVVCVHGYRGGPFAIEQRVWCARKLYDAGLDVVLYTLPFHGVRCPFRGVREPLFPSQRNIARTNEGFGQTAWELRGLLGWIRKRGTRAAGLAGMSLGGYCASLLATIEPNLDFVIPFIPLADFTDAVVAHEEIRGVAIDEELQESSRRALHIHRPLARAPVVPGERVLVVGAEADRITGRLHAERLARHFDGELTWFRGGHILQYGRDEGFRAMTKFLSRRGWGDAPPPTIPPPTTAPPTSTN